MFPLRRSVEIFGPGIGWPSYFVSAGLGSKVSTCDMPPFRNRKMTCFALGAKCGWRKASACSVPCRAARPKPPPICWRNYADLAFSVHTGKLSGAQKGVQIVHPALPPVVTYSTPNFISAESGARA